MTVKMVGFREQKTNARMNRVPKSRVGELNLLAIAKGKMGTREYQGGIWKTKRDKCTYPSKNDW